MPKVTAKGLFQVLKDAFKGFGEHKIPKMSASLAYYTVFSLGPLLIVIIYTFGKIFGRDAVEGSIDDQLKAFVGPESAAQIQEIIKNAWISEDGGIAAIIGVITLLVGATTIFAEIQDSVNTIWGLKSKPKKAIWQLLKVRLLSFGIIVSLGFLLIVSLAVTTIIESLSGRLQELFPGIGVVLLYIINLVITIAVISSLFGVIFKVLPDAKIRWKEVLAGAIATSILFIIGKFAISLYIGSSDIGSTYGTAGSLVIVLLWIYYSSFILYFGAEFTRAYAHFYGHDIRPNKFAVVVSTIEVETGAKTVQEATLHKEQIQKGHRPARHHHEIEAEKEGRPPAPAGPLPAPPVKSVMTSLAVLALASLFKRSE